MHGKGRYTPWPGRGPYGWKVSSAPWPIPVPGSFADTGDWLSAGTWLYAPGDSHLHSFGFLDARKVEAIRGNSTRPSDWYSVLLIKYKDTSKGYWGEGVEYAFFSKNHERLEFIFLMMSDAESPGEIGWSHLTSEMIPYMEVK